MQQKKVIHAALALAESQVRKTLEEKYAQCPEVAHQKAWNDCKLSTNKLFTTWISYLYVPYSVMDAISVFNKIQFLEVFITSGFVRCPTTERKVSSVSTGIVLR